MTAQISDHVRFEGSEWILVGVNGGPLFDAAAAGLQTIPPGTACWRGFTCAYAVRDGAFLLDQVDFCSRVPPGPLFGRDPEPSRRGLGFRHAYTSLAHPIPFTGGLRLGRDFIQELYVHMGFHPAWKYRHVTELELAEGKVTGATDQSELAARQREKLAHQDVPPRDAPRSRIAEWVARTFSRRY